MAWFSRKDKNISPDVVKKDIPGGLWIKCPSCSEIQYKPELEKSFYVCQHCKYHFRMAPETYFELLIDSKSNTFEHKNEVVKNEDFESKNQLSKCFYLYILFKITIDNYLWYVRLKK